MGWDGMVIPRHRRAGAGSCPGVALAGQLGAALSAQFPGRNKDALHLCKPDGYFPSSS